MNNNYIKAILILFIGITMSAAFAFLLENGSAQFHKHKLDRMQELFTRNTRYDVLFIGSSRTHTTIDPSIVDSITGLRSYNAGVEGGNLFEFNLTLNAYLEKHPAPRLVILSVDANSFDIRKKMFFPFQYFWVLQNRQVQDALKGDENFRLFAIKNIKFLRHIYYDDYTKALAIRGLLGQNEYQYGDFSGKLGFATNGYNCLDTMVQYVPSKVKIDPAAVEMLRSMIDTCKKRDIAIVLTYAPEFRHRLQLSYSNFEVFLKTMEQFIKSSNISFYRDDYLPMCSIPCFFSNYGHVNTYGAIEYSHILGRRIRDSLLNKK